MPQGAHLKSIANRTLPNFASLVLTYELWEPRILDRVKLRDIARNQCRWPYGDPFEGSFAFCGLPVVGKFCYCEGHLFRARRVINTSYKRYFEIKQEQLQAYMNNGKAK